MSEQKCELIQLGVAQTEPVSVVNKTGEFVAVTEKCAEIHRYEVKEMEGLDVLSILANPSLQHGKEFHNVFNGDCEPRTYNLVLGDGNTTTVEVTPEPVEIDRTDYVKCHSEIVENAKTQDGDCEKDSDTEDPLEAIPEHEAQEICRNIRIQSPAGEVSLAEIIMDISAAHNEIEQTKAGAITLHETINQRLRDERKTNPGSPNVAVLEDVAKSAFDLFTRLHCEDEEENKTI